MTDGKKHRMTAEKLEALTSIAFSWVIPRGCSAKLKYIKMKEMRYKAEVARHEGTEYDLKDIVNAVALTDPVIDVPQSFGKEMTLSPKSAPCPDPDVPQSTRAATLENKELDPMSTTVTLVDDCVLRHLSCHQLDSSYTSRCSDDLAGSLAEHQGVLGVADEYPIIQANTCYCTNVCTRLQRCDSHINHTLERHGELLTHKVYPSISEHPLQHGASMVSNRRLAMANTQMSHQHRSILLQAKLVESLHLEMLAQLHFDRAYIARYTTADQTLSSPK